MCIERPTSSSRNALASLGVGEPPSTIVARLLEHVVGIDTRARTHTYRLTAAASGAVIDTAIFGTPRPGESRAIT